MTWQPLNDHWEKYQAYINEADEEGLLDDPDNAQEIIYPRDLWLGEGEKEDIHRFVVDRTNEIIGHIQATGNFNPNLVGTYLFRSVLAGMKWEKERIGKF